MQIDNRFNVVYHLLLLVNSIKNIMKAKISKVGLVGDVNESKEFYIPLINKNKVQMIILKDGNFLYK